MGSTGSATAKGLEDLQRGESESPRKKSIPNLEANALHSPKHGTKVKRAIPLKFGALRLIRAFAIVSATAGSVAGSRGKFFDKYI